MNISIALFMNMLITKQKYKLNNFYHKTLNIARVRVPVNRFNYTSWMTVFPPTDRHKLARNRYEIEAFCDAFVLSFGFINFYWYCSIQK